jgi:predicted transcriptional regulator
MRRSKMERYIDILKVIAQRGPLKLTHIMYKANISYSVLTQYLGFLIKQGLVEERIIKRNTVVYLSTPRGISVLKSFKEMNKALLLIESEDKMQQPLY